MLNSSSKCISCIFWERIFENLYLCSRCPACPESFHVEFLLDRHMQTHHSHKELNFHATDQKSPINNNTLDYHHPYSTATAAAAAAAAAALNKSGPLYGFPKFYNPLQAADALKHPSHLFQGLYDSMAKSQRFLHDAQKSYLSPNKINIPPFNVGRNFSPENGPRGDLYSPGSGSGAGAKSNAGPTASSLFPPNIGRYMAGNNETIKESGSSGGGRSAAATPTTETKMFSCGICERNDFSTESEAHTHRKISHNLKTGVSLRCAYCNGDFRSR